MSNRRTCTKRPRKARSEREDVLAPDESQFVPPEEPGDAGPPSRWLQRLWAATRIGFGVLLVLAVSGAVAWGAHRYALTTPRFAIRDVDVEGARRFSADRIQALAGVELGTNVFALDVPAATARLRSDPWIAEGRITRRLPGHVRIEVREREAGALAVIGDRLFLVTPAGEIFKPFEEGDPFDLPTVTGLRLDALGRDWDREIDRLQTAMELLRQYKKVPLAHVFAAQEVHLKDGGGAVLTVGQQGVTLHLGSGPWKQKLLRATRVVERAQARGELPGILFLDNQAHPERVVVRMR